MIIGPRQGREAVELPPVNSTSNQCVELAGVSSTASTVKSLTPLAIVASMDWFFGPHRDEAAPLVWTLQPLDLDSANSAWKKHSAHCNCALQKRVSLFNTSAVVSARFGTHESIFACLAAYASVPTAIARRIGQMALYDEARAIIHHGLPSA